MADILSTQRRARLSDLLSLERISTFMGLFGLVVLIGVGIVSAWNERRIEFREAQMHARNSAFFLADHAQRLFEVSDIALRSAMIVTAPYDWSTLEASEPLWKTLRESSALLPYVDDLWLNDETGRLRLTTFAFPAPFSNAADRPIFSAVRSGDRFEIGDRIVGRVTRKPTFLVGRRLSGPDGQFRGMISATLDLNYFTQYWRRLELANRERIAVVDVATGAILIASDETDASRAQVIDKAAMQAAVAADGEAGTFEPEPGRYGFYHRVGDLPLLLLVEFERASVIAAWHDWLLHLAPFALAFFVSFAGIMLLGRRQGRRETEAARALAAARTDLEAANQHLEARVAERTADLRESNEEIQRFAYIVSHDLRAPLVNITGFTSELEELKPALFPANAPEREATHRDFDEAIGFIRSSAEKMDRLIGAILSLSREGRRRFTPEAIDLDVLLSSVVDGFAHRLQIAGASVQIEKLPSLRADRVALEQIFSNLIDNGVKFFRPSVPGEIHISGERRGDRVVIQVQDNGRGIAARDRERVFELFRRAGASDQPGEGIGLAHVRALVRRLGGSIVLDSVLGQGSNFVVDLPAAEDEHEGQPVR